MESGGRQERKQGRCEGGFERAKVPGGKQFPVETLLFNFFEVSSTQEGGNTTLLFFGGI